MNKVKIYIGSKNINKINAVKSVFENELYEVISMNVNSQVSAQPKNDEETIKGALNRALCLPTDGFRIGLEAGVEVLNDILFLTNFGVLIDENQNIYYAGGTRIPLPKEIKNLIFGEGLELSDAMSKYFQVKDIKHKNGAIGYFTEDLVTRKDIFVHIVKLLYGQYLYRKGK